MNILSSPYWVLIAGLWYLINGILHDVFVIKNHKGPYDRELLRLLMDGHLLILSGVLMGLSFLLFDQDNHYSLILALITGISMIVYCFMIFPFLKSLVTMVISLMVVVFSLLLF